MAHGFLSYQDNRGDLDQLRNAKDLYDGLNWLRKQFRKDLRVVNANIKEIRDTAQLPQGGTPLLKGGNDPALPPSSPLQRMLGGSALTRTALPGAMAVNPSVMGGPLATAGFGGRPLRPEGFVGDRIVDIGATNLGVERDLGGDDMFVKRLNTIDDGVGGGSGEVVQAIDRLTFVTMSLVAATKEQTNQQKMIAAAQQQQAEKLARQAKAAAEENALEMGGDLSGNLAYQKSLLASGAGMMGGGGRGGPGMGIGGKALTKNILKAATKRGAARTGTRLGAAVGGKMLGGFGARMGAKLGAKSVGKVAGSAIAKSLGKKIPLVGLGLGAIFAAQRAMQGDFVGAGLELASGAASTVPGIGTAGSVGIDAALAARDMGMVPFAEGGIVAEPTNALIGEAGREGVFPLEGSKGKKTFLQFGEGILEAQRRNKTEYGKIQAEGLKNYYEKQNGWEKWWTGFKEFLSQLPVIGHLFRDSTDPTDDGKGGGGDLGSGLRRSLLGTFGGYDKLDPTAAGSGLGTYGTGLKTGPSSQIGGSSAYHIDSQFKSSLSMEEKVKMMDDLAAAYAARGRKIEFSNNAVAGQVWNSEASMEEKMALLQKAFEAHQIPRGREVDAGGFNRIDYYIPFADQNRFHASAEGAEILVPTRGATTMDYAQGGDYGAFVNLKDKDGNVIFRTGHGDVRGARSGSVDLSKAKSASPAASPSTPPAGAQSSQDIKQNFGLKAHDKFMFQHNGEMYEAYKTENGFDIYKHGGNLIPQKLDTSGGKNAGVVESLIEAGTKRTSDADNLSSASADTATTIAARSSENAVASLTPAQSAIIQNFYGSDGKQGGGNQPASVAFGISSRDTGTNAFYELGVRTLS